jgi:hypothetical protein
MPETNQTPAADDQGPADAQQVPKKLSADVDPWVIANDPTLEPAAKLARLRQLEQDVRQLAVARDEGMTGHSNLPPLQTVLAALAHVAGPEGGASSSPNKA